jgi:hypothetical protein
MSCRECAQSPWVSHREIKQFLIKFGEGDGLRNRRLAECKMLIGQVLISRTLTDYGEVAERLKAVVLRRPEITKRA